MQEYLKVSVVIPTYNRRQSLLETIESFLSFDYIPNEFIVVDQSECKKADETFSALKKIFFKHDLINFIFINLENPSLTHARNVGFSKCKNEIVIMCDDDIEVFDNTIKYIDSLFSNNEKLGMLACQDIDSLNKKEGKLGYLLGFKNFFKRRTYYITKSMFGRFPLKSVEECKAEWAMGFFFVIRKSAVLKTGIIWDEELKRYAYAEDLDFSYRLFVSFRKLGYESKYSKNIKVLHKVSKEYRLPSREASFMYVLNRKYLSYKFGFSFFSRLLMGFTNRLFIIKTRINKHPYKDLKDAIRASKLLTKDHCCNYSSFFMACLNGIKND